MRVRFFDIDWDMTEETRTPQDCGLPSECVLETDDDIDLRRTGRTCSAKSTAGS